MKDRLSSKNNKQSIQIKSKTCIKGSDIREDKSSVTKKRGRPVGGGGNSYEKEAGYVRTEPNMTSESASVTKNDMVSEQKSAKLEEMKRKIQENKMKADTGKPNVVETSKVEKAETVKVASKNNDFS